MPVFAVTDSIRSDKPSLFVGIDPGKSGGIAVMTADGKVLRCQAMPDTVADVCGFLREMNSQGVAVVYVEKVGGFTKAGGPQPGSAMFKFGYGVGVLHGLLHAVGMRMAETSPAAWQKSVGVPVKGASDKKTHKNNIKIKAQQLFPQVKVTLRTADALLIAEHCRMTESKKWS